MPEPTPEALAWRERVNREAAAGIICGAREICSDCLRPMRKPWASGTSKAIPACVCTHTERSPRYNGFVVHGLEGITNGLQKGSRTYG